MSSSDQLSANAWWFHMFRAMVDSGDVARIGPHALAVYIVIKSHANHRTGKAWPGVEMIAAKSGVSIAQVKRSLIVLEQAGYLARERVGRSNHYTLREKLPVADESGRTLAVATWDYTPGLVQRAVEELKSMLLSGQLCNAKNVRIDRVVMQVNIGGGNTIIENSIASHETILAELERLPFEMREKLRRNLKPVLPG